MSTTDRLKMLKSKLASARALYAPGHPDIARLEREVQGLEAEVGPVAGTNEIRRELETAKGELAQAQEKYSPDHPDVERLTRRVAALQGALDNDGSADTAMPDTGTHGRSLADQAEPTLAGDASDAPVRPDQPDNPAYIETKSQLSSTRNQLLALDAEENKLRAQIATYRRGVTASPHIEQEYHDLMRDYENAQVKYREVRSKQMEARLAQNLESDRKSERFTLIEPPLPPEEPVSPNRPAILIIGLILTLATVAGVVALLETVDATVRGRADMSDAFTVPPLALVPHIVTDAESHTRRRTFTIAAGATVGTFVLAAVIVHFLFRPLDVLWFIAMRHLGL
jgi:hypothetical protein